MMILNKKRIAKKKTHKIKTKTTAARMKRNRVSKSRDMNLDFIGLEGSNTQSRNITQDLATDNLVPEVIPLSDQPVTEVTSSPLKAQPYHLHLVDPETETPCEISINNYQVGSLSDLISQGPWPKDAPFQPYLYHTQCPQPSVLSDHSSTHLEPQRSEGSDVTSCLQRFQALLDQAQYERQRLLAQEAKDERAMMERLFGLIQTYFDTRVA